MRYTKLGRFCAIATTAILASTIHLDSLPSGEIRLSLDSAAEARRSGGRSGGGSFRSSPPSRSNSSPSRSNSAPSRPANPPSNSQPSYPQPYYGGGPVIVPVPVGPTQTYPNGYNSQTQNGQPQSGTRSASAQPASAGEIILGFIILGASLAVLILVIYFIIKAIRNRSQGGMTKHDREINNNIVTVNKIQVALLAEARSLQTELTNLALEVESDTPEGLQQLLQESALALLRNPESWSHVLASSQTVKNRAAAETVFNQLSVAERSKFNVESLVNVGGRVQRRELKLNPDEDPAAYIVVTLLVGTAHDKPLFTEIRTEQALQEVLEKMAALPAEYLMVFELLWTPQDSADSLTYDELLMEFTDMIQI